ncbi:DNA topoisomerase III [Betaproteobacteria bacterium]|nr:DNA topoisomerase III [Betaproteobacteria bacterium]
MNKSLVIAEKPSVASDIAKALGGFKKVKDVYEREDMVITSAVGHLLKMVVPEKHDIKRGKWSLTKLPHLPPKFTLEPFEKTESRLKTIVRQIKRKDVDLLINACDAAREGELIFRHIVEYTKSKHKIKRLWLQSMTPEAIRTGFNNLKSDDDLIPLSNAAKCRSEADWLVGINSTRAFTAFNSLDGGFYKTPVGRVKTPTLAMVVRREDEINKFVSDPFFEINVNFATKKGKYKGKYFDKNFKKDKENQKLKDSRIWNRDVALEIIKEISGQEAVALDETKTLSQSPPTLFDLTSLQREANNKFGFSAKNTVGLAQALYDKHKLITYPRTDSKFLPEDYVATVKETISSLRAFSNYQDYCSDALKLNLISDKHKVFNDKKVSDHFAIIPTGVAHKKLSEPELKLFDLITKRFLGIFFPPAKYLNTKRITSVKNYTFKTEGKVLVEPGWQKLYMDSTAIFKESLIALDENEKVVCENISLEELETKPPAHYTEATLLSAMETAGKLVEDEVQREAMVEKGIGTPATRAGIIEELIKDNYLIRDGRDLLVSHSSIRLMQLLNGLDIKELSRADLTGEWEYKLKEIECGKIDKNSFLKEIKTMVSNIVEKTKSFDSKTIPGDYSVLAVPCPKCNGLVNETYKRYACASCDFSISKTPGARFLSVSEAETFIKEKKLGPLEGFRSKRGFLFAGTIVLTDDYKLNFDFESADDDNLEELKYEKNDIIGACPKCSGDVVIHKTSYTCSNTVGKNKSCNFRSGLTILQQTISIEQMTKLLNGGRTDLLDSFVSSRTRRKFKAFLILKDDKSIGFEFVSKSKKN